MLACVLSNFNSSTQEIQKISSSLYLMRICMDLSSHLRGDSDLMGQKRFVADCGPLVREKS